MGNDALHKNVPSDKPYLRLNQVSVMTDVPVYVIRSWENHFPSIKPRLTHSGKRRYDKITVERILIIKHLLHLRKLPLHDVKRIIREERNEPDLPSDKEERKTLTMDDIRSELLDIRKFLD